MKKILLLIALLMPLIKPYAQIIDPDAMAVDSILADSILLEDTIEVVLLVDEMENALVYQDSLIRQLMVDKRLGIERGQKMVNGFRVQVYSSNQQQVAKNEALILQQELESKLEIPVYAISEPPFWKVRIGNFLTREEAAALRAVLIQVMPELQGSTYVVPDKVYVNN